MDLLIRGNMPKKLNKLEKEMEKRFKHYMRQRGWLLRSIEGKAGEVAGSPDVFAISQNGVSFSFELKTLSSLSAGQILILKKSNTAFLVTELAGGAFLFQQISGDGVLLEKAICDLEFIKIKYY